MRMYFAHSGNLPDKSDWQGLADHLNNVARLAEEFGKPLGIAEAARVAGLFHDLGKYTQEFQRRLQNDDIRVDHSTAGAALLPELTKGRDRGVAQLIAYGIAGHHAGLPDMSGDASLSGRVEEFVDNLDPVWKQELELQLEGLEPKLRFEKTHAAFQFAFLGRMIFSCLVDADFKDTESFYNNLEDTTVDRGWPSLQSLLPQFSAALADHFAAMPEPDRMVNRLRREILAHVRCRASDSPGLFTLTVPTGGGKTLASLAFALDHAKLHGHSRIIYAIPFTSIIDQTAAIFKAVLGDDFVLEHHSAIDDARFTSREARDKLRLAMEDWAAPIVVTTNVQLFESLFAARPGQARKVHNIGRSIIILDEAQTVPRKLLLPCIRAIDELARNYGCTIVLCTATQPALGAPNFPEGLPLEGRELAPEPSKLAEALRRVTIHRAGDQSNDDLVAALFDTAQALVIVNSRKHALALYRAAEAAGLEGVIHLSTRQYAADRRRIIENVRLRLKHGEPCRVIATSLVEAGVDLDFPLVWRAEAGLDQIAQAAGRCNREGKRPVTESIVTVFSAPDFPPPPEIKGLIGDVARMEEKHHDLLSPIAIADYFGEVYWRLGPDLDAKNILKRFTVGKTSGTDFAYRCVAADFQMIESGMVPVIVAVEDQAREAVDNLGKPWIPSGALARDLQPFIIQVPPRARQRLTENGRVAFAVPKERGDQFAVLIDESLYRKDVGLVWEDADYLTLEQLLV